MKENTLKHHPINVVGTTEDLIHRMFQNKFDEIAAIRKEFVDGIAVDPLYFIDWKTERVIEGAVEEKSLLWARKNIWEKMVEEGSKVNGHQTPKVREKAIEEALHLQVVMSEYMDSERQILLEQPPKHSSTSVMSNLISFKTYETKAKMYSRDHFGETHLVSICREMKKYCEALYELHEALK